MKILTDKTTNNENPYWRKEIRTLIERGGNEKPNGKKLKTLTEKEKKKHVNRQQQQKW